MSDRLDQGLSRLDITTADIVARYAMQYNYPEPKARSGNNEPKESVKMVRKQLKRDGSPQPLLLEGSLAARAAAWLTAHAPEVYLVGGYIRDRVLGRESHDVDFTVPQNSLPLARTLADHLGGYFVLLDRSRGTARVVCHGEGESAFVDLTLLQGQTLAQDLMHRDFTINAIALRLGDVPPRLIDPHKGQEDLQHRLIRAVTPHVFTDDPLRLLRTVRLSAELGFEIEPQTETLLRRNTSLIHLPAPERIRYELVKTLRTSKAPRWVSFLADTSLLISVVPSLKPHMDRAVEAFDKIHQLITALKDGSSCRLGLQALVQFAPDLQTHLSHPTNEERCREDVLGMAALLSPLSPDEVREAFLALRFSGFETHYGWSIIASWQKVSQLQGLDVSRRAIYHYFRGAEDAGIEALLLALSQSTEGQRTGQLVACATRLLGAYFCRYRSVIAPLPLIDGHTIMSELGLEPGPRVGELLAALREAQAAGEVHTPQEALAFVWDWASAHR